MPSRQLALVPGSPREEFGAVMKDIVRVVRRSHPQLAKTDSWLLDELNKGRGFEMFFRLCGLAQQCVDPVDSAYLSERLRGWILGAHPALNLELCAAFRTEQRANGLADLAQFEYLIAPSKATADRAIETLLQQEIASRACLDALHVARIRSGRSIGLVRP